MPNIKLNYLYRDAGNYKNHGAVVFQNRKNLALELVATQIKTHLIDSEYFYADAWQLPDLHFGKWDNQLDHTFHEFDRIEITTEEATMPMDIIDWLKSLLQFCQ